ncbi:TPA: MFS transporter [Candidatus Poribacteria bacterium]|nr:MFS transporter [Candidatus Poribacteria bacterium]HIC01587.1 MFS transporter [Candidatus Poribacteria bacterium]HIC17900.1 MFS transporter [Candidatus Poribacteria bacterium]HIO08549.1 MFS transporter [Candidatus Poribacteria bacterium]HIO46430.1 MFS transporter [Candidatus Poribacteria bacterium]
MQRPPKVNPKKYLWWCCILHVINDGYIASLSLLLPFIAKDLDLTYTESGLLKTAIHGAISVAQVPAGFLAERFGDIVMLGLGGLWFSFSYMILFLAFSYSFTLILILSAGVGGGVYHPVGTALVSNAYLDGESGSAISTLNFFGDVGKAIFPFLAGVLVVRFGWRVNCVVLGMVGLGTSILYLLFFRREIRLKRLSLEVSGDQFDKTSRRWGIAQPGQFTLYSVLGLLDNGIRSAVTTFLGFLLIEKRGIQESSVGGMMSLVFLGGALGKLLCGLSIQKFGVKKIILVTEILMVLGCFVLPMIPSRWILLLFLPLFGFMLNGTSSVIYVGVAPTLRSEFRSRGYALHYTLSFLSSAITPYLFGLVGDAYGLNTIFHATAIVMLLGLPLVFFLKERENFDKKSR